ncbi:MAG: hypothetical protein HRU11_14735 [Parvularculaceae bacterium]|nr:hypothetical protein [Parvularculaceae bacterium]
MTDADDLMKPLDMEGDGIHEAHVAGIDLNYRAPRLPDDVRLALPQPILDGDQHLIELYWRAWDICFDRVRDPEPSTGLVRFCDAAFSENIFQWDTCFMIGFLRYATHLLPVTASLDNFYAKQHSDGFICREISSVSGDDFWKPTHPSSVNPPLFADAEWRLFEVTGNRERLTSVVGPLSNYFAWLKRNRIHSDGKGYWTTALASGMDNSPRAYRRGGPDADEHYGHMWMCLTAQQALTASRLVSIGEVLDDHHLVATYGNEARELKAYIDEQCWNESVEAYTDKDQHGEPTDVLTPASLWPALAGCGSTEQIDALERMILDPEKFWRPHAIPSVAHDHPTYHPSGNYWQGGVWPPMTNLVIRGLASRNRVETAYRVAMNHLENLWSVYKATGTLWENYAPEEARRGNISRPEFVGWTGCGPIEALLETIIGVQVDANAQSIRWTSIRSDRHGVSHLRFGSNVVSLCFVPDDVAIEVEAKSPFKLEFVRDGKTKSVNVDAGRSKLRLSS